MITILAIYLGQFLLTLIIYIFLIEKFTHKKPWYYPIGILAFLVIILPLIGWNFGGWTYCRGVNVEPHCGLDDYFVSLIIAIDFAIIALAVGIRRIFKR